MRHVWTFCRLVVARRTLAECCYDSGALTLCSACDHINCIAFVASCISAVYTRIVEWHCIQVSSWHQQLCQGYCRQVGPGAMCPNTHVGTCLASGRLACCTARKEIQLSITHCWQHSICSACAHEHHCCWTSGMAVRVPSLAQVPLRVLVRHLQTRCGSCTVFMHVLAGYFAGVGTSQHLPAHCGVYTGAAGCCKAAADTVQVS
jgi:hypothetical protein